MHRSSLSRAWKKLPYSKLPESALHNQSRIVLVNYWSQSSLFAHSHSLSIPFDDTVLLQSVFCGTALRQTLTVHESWLQKMRNNSAAGFKVLKMTAGRSLHCSDYTLIRQLILTQRMSTYSSLQCLTVIGPRASCKWPGDKLGHFSLETNRVLQGAPPLRCTSIKFSPPHTLVHMHAQAHTHTVLLASIIPYSSICKTGLGYCSYLFPALNLIRQQQTLQAN